MLINPKGKEKGSYCVFRGGGWDSNARACRAAFRNRDTFTYSGLGFRVALTPVVRKCESKV